MFPLWLKLEVLCLTHCWSKSSYLRSLYLRSLYIRSHYTTFGRATLALPSVAYTRLSSYPRGWSLSQYPPHRRNTSLVVQILGETTVRWDPITTCAPSMHPGPGKQRNINDVCVYRFGCATLYTFKIGNILETQNHAKLPPIYFGYKKGRKAPGDRRALSEH